MSQGQPIERAAATAAGVTTDIITAMTAGGPPPPRPLSHLPMAARMQDAEDRLEQLTGQLAALGSTVARELGL